MVSRFSYASEDACGYVEALLRTPKEPQEVTTLQELEVSATSEARH